jgi:hypothetical protein
MNTPRPLLRLFAAGGALCATAAVGWADSISPSAYSTTLSVGESKTITKTVTVSAGPATSSKVDVMFLADETGSMGGFIAAVEAAAGGIVAATSGLGDVKYGVGGYRDFGDAFAYHEITDLTTGAAAAAAIPAWAASGGGDYPEAVFNALSHVATDTTWRAGSERMVVIFGDAPDDNGAGAQAAAIASLVANGVTVLGISVSGNDFNAPVGPGFKALNDNGAFMPIVTATGGAYYEGISVATIAATIASAITTSVETYSKVALDITEAPAGVGVAYTPLSYMGAFDRSVERSFDFEVTFTGLAVGTYDFHIYGTVDGGRVATETDHIVVAAAGVPDGGSSVLLLGSALAALGLLRRRRMA